MNKINKLQEILKNMKSVLIAYSGGVDSTFLLKIAKDVLKENVFAVIAKSETYPEREYKEAIKLVKNLKVEYLTITTKELLNQNFFTNSQERCYYCKKELFTKLKQIAFEKNINYVIDGTNYDDTKDFRPGVKAICELGIQSPLKETGFTKKEIRLLSQKMNLSTWNKPSFACLASRIPYGEKITEEKLAMIEKAESYLCKLGFKQVRIRHHNNIARIEVFPEEIPNFIISSVYEKIVQKLKKIGYKYITLDLEGYRTGSMNEVLKNDVLKNKILKKRSFRKGKNG
ncbi:MAG: ATP-dependent sacrificial sulfur transferase LarE [bacterium]